MNIPLPLSIVEDWLESYINPQVEKLGICCKQATTFSSVGLDFSLSPNFAEKFSPPPETDLTFGFLSDTVLAQIIQNRDRNFLIEKGESLKEPMSPKDLDVLGTDKPALGVHKCPQFLYLSYTNQYFLFGFKTFGLTFHKQVFKNYKVVSQFLFYKAKFLENELNLRHSGEELNALNLYRERYLDFLLTLCFKCLSKA